MLARLLEVFVHVRGGSLNAIGNETLLLQSAEVGVEGDECYFLGPMKPFPDLAIEIVHTHHGIDKLEIYRRMRVAEVWFWIDGAIEVHRLERRRYRRSEVSHLLPELDLQQIAKIVLTHDESRQAETIRAYGKSLRSPPKRLRPHGPRRKQPVPTRKRPIRRRRT
jgi:hypothetical protein